MELTHQHHTTRHQEGSAPAPDDSVSWSELQRRHGSVTGNTVRAGVLGANDGLVSNLSLVAGVAGAALASRIVFITGLAGLFAGAGAMAMGEWISVQTAREMHARELALEAEELERFPLEETDELAGLYERRGLPTDGARSLAESVMKNPATALRVMAREELGIDSDQLSPAKAAASSAFAVLPWRNRSPIAVCHHERYPGAGGQRDRQRPRPLSARRSRYPAHRPLAATLRPSSGGFRARRGDDYVLHRSRRRACRRVARCARARQTSSVPPVLRRAEVPRADDPQSAFGPAQGRLRKKPDEDGQVGQ